MAAQGVLHARSPFYIKVSNASLSYAVMKLYVYEGVLTTDKPASPQYTITKKEVSSNNYVVFEISELVRDFISNQVDMQTVWVETEIKSYTSADALISTSSEANRGYNGYGYFRDGVNPNHVNRLMISNSIIYKQESDTKIIPVSTDNTVKVCYYNFVSPVINDEWNTSEEIWNTSEELWSSYELISCDTITPSTDSDLKIQYVTIPAAAERVIINSAEVFDVKNVCEPKYNPKEVLFTNKFGATQRITFFKKSKENLNVKKESYKANTFNEVSLNYSTQDHQFKSFNVSGKESITMNTGFVDESFNAAIRELLLSESVWVVDGLYTLPLIPKTSSVEYKTVLNDKLLNYTIDFDYAFDKINDIR